MLIVMASRSEKPIAQDRAFAFWKAYFEILRERVPLVDEWRDGSITWHPRVVQKLLWYTDIPNTAANRQMAHDWLMSIAIPRAKGKRVTRAAKH